jgi:phage gp37-like protein
MATYTEIEENVLALLAPLKEDGVKNVDSYGGEFSPDSFGAIPVQLPAVFVHVDGFSNDSDGGPVDQRTYGINLYVASKNLRGETEARRGAYSIADAARALLNRQEIPGCEWLTLKSEKLVAYSKLNGTCVFNIAYSLASEPVTAIYEE